MSCARSALPDSAASATIHSIIFVKFLKARSPEKLVYSLAQNPAAWKATRNPYLQIRKPPEVGSIAISLIDVRIPRLFPVVRIYFVAKLCPSESLLPLLR